MRKNDAFKSFLSPVTIAVGMIALVALAFYANINRASAATIIDEQLVWNAELNYEAGVLNPTGIGLATVSAEATVSVKAVTIKMKMRSGRGDQSVTANIKTMDCTTGELGATIANSGMETVLDNGIYQNYTFTWASVVPITRQTNCYRFGFPEQIDLAVWNSSPLSDNYGLTWTATPFDEIVDWGQSPYFILYEDIAEPTIEILQPPAAATITSTDFLYTFNATFDVDSNWSVFMQLLDATTSIPKKSYFYSGQPTASVVSRSAALPVTYNGDFILQATARDEVTFETAIATRAITMNVTGLKANDLGLVTIESETEAYCDAETEAVAKALCKIAYFLFVPDEAISEDLDAQIAETKSYPPMSWAMILSDTITAEMGTASAAWTIIPTFVDDFFEWLWYILFGLSCLWFSQKLFKA